MQVESSFAGKAPARGVEVSTAPFGSDVPLGEPSWYQNLNTPYYNASHLAWRAKLRDFFEKEVEPSASPARFTTRCFSRVLLSRGALWIFPNSEG